MPFTSYIGPSELVIDDDNYTMFVGDTVVNGEYMSRGLLPRDWDKEPYGSVGSAFPSELLVPRDEWDDRIEEMERTKTRLTDLCDQAGLSVLNQNGTNYCWINAPVHCVEVTRVSQNEQLIRLSPASCGAIIKNYRNVGGWGTEGLEFIRQRGIVPQELWPANAISRQYDNEETREVRKQFMVYEWNELRPRNEDQLISCLLHRIPVAVGYNWWSHEVTAMDPVVITARSKYGIRINNSWGTGWGENGRGILKGTRHLPDDAVIARTVTPGDN